MFTWKQQKSQRTDINETCVRTRQEMRVRNEINGCKPWKRYECREKLQGNEKNAPMWAVFLQVPV